MPKQLHFDDSNSFIYNTLQPADDVLDALQPIVMLWSSKHGLWFKRTGFHSLSLSLSSQKLHTAPVQRNSAGTNSRKSFLGLFSPLVEWATSSGRRGWQGRAWKVTDGTGTGVHVTPRLSVPQVLGQAVTNGHNFHLFITVLGGPQYTCSSAPTHKSLSC